MTRFRKWTDPPLALAGFALLTPLLIAIATVVALSMPGPPVVRRAVSESGRVFLAYQFRLSTDGGEPGSVGA